MLVIFALILVAAGLGLAIGTWAEFWPVLRGVFALSLLFWGATLFVVGFSERRARRLYQKATREEHTPANTADDAVVNNADAAS